MQIEFVVLLKNYSITIASNTLNIVSIIFKQTPSVNHQTIQDYNILRKRLKYLRRQLEQDMYHKWNTMLLYYTTLAEQYLHVLLHHPIDFDNEQKIEDIELYCTQTAVYETIVEEEKDALQRFNQLRLMPVKTGNVFLDYIHLSQNKPCLQTV